MSRMFDLKNGVVLLGDEEAVVELAQEDVRELALEVVLLRRELTDAVVLRPKRGPQIVLGLRTSGVPEPTGTVTRTERDQVRFDLPANLLGYLESVLLRCYRDGMAEVDHIHVAGTLSGKPYDLTVMFELPRAPLTPEEVEALTDDRKPPRKTP